MQISDPVSAGLSARGVTVAFPGGMSLRGVDLTVEPGQVVVLLGAPGSGRSTLLRCLAGLRRPDAGSVRCNGVDLARLRGRALRRHLAEARLVFQEFRLDRDGALRSTVLTGAPTPFDGLVRRAAVDAEVRTRLARGWRGDRRIATVLRPDRTDVRLDGGTAVIDEIARLARHEELLALLTVPDVATALRVADRIVGLRAGRVMWDLPASLVDDRDLAELDG